MNTLKPHKMYNTTVGAVQLGSGWYDGPNGGTEMKNIDYDKGYYQGTLHPAKPHLTAEGYINRGSLAQGQKDQGWYSSAYGGSEMDEIDHDNGHYQNTLHAPRAS